MIHKSWCMHAPKPYPKGPHAESFRVSICPWCDKPRGMECDWCRELQPDWTPAQASNYSIIQHCEGVIASTGTKNAMVLYNAIRCPIDGPCECPANKDEIERGFIWEFLSKELESDTGWHGGKAGNCYYVSTRTLKFKTACLYADLGRVKRYFAVLDHSANRGQEWSATWHHESRTLSLRAGVDSSD